MNGCFSRKNDFMLIDALIPIVYVMYSVSIKFLNLLTLMKQEYYFYTVVFKFRPK